jgi:hypothetical protein
MRIDPLLNAAADLFNGWIDTVAEDERTMLAAALSKGAQLKLEIGLNPEPYRRNVSLAITLHGTNGERVVLTDVAHDLPINAN